MKLKPLADKLIVKRDEAEAVSKGGIVLPEVAKERPRKGKVLAVGRGTLNDNGTHTPPEVKVGDSVLFSAYAGQETECCGEKLLIMSESEVLAVVEE